MNQRCLLIADDLTGGADAGAQFAKRGLTTLLIFGKDNARVDFSKYSQPDVLVINTDSRGLSPEKASSLISNLFKNYDKELFSIIYKKIDSTLRGNIGYEIDAILKKMNGSLCLMAPSYPEQNRRLVGGILIVGEKPLALTEVAQNTTSPIQESHVHKLLQRQSQNNVGWIDLTHVASGSEGLRKAVEKEQKKGTRVIIFDAVSRQDLANIAEVGFFLKKKPLFVGSAGLAEEVAKKITPPEGPIPDPLKQKGKTFKHIFIIGGSASSVTHQQLRRIERGKVPAYQLNKTTLLNDDARTQAERKEISKKVSDALSQGMAILKTTPDMLQSEDSKDLPIHLKITTTLAEITISALIQSKVDVHDLALILTGGDTAQSIINTFDIDGIKIEGELLEGIIRGHLIGGKWDGLTVVTKAGAFGKEDALERIVEMLQPGSTLTKEGR
ncbi:MAG: hypothetical protein FJ115_07780 [Deltaproteobacteria bacterium]|nr:hypothetical protein [Deltaproteobacteria bacterium]